MNTKTKKGFTLTELIIVVVIIGILAAVLIPTLTACVKKAKISNDKQLVRNLNLALASDETTIERGGKHLHMQEALDAAFKAGYDVEKINATKSDNEILWDSANDVFCYYNDGEIEYIPSSATHELSADVEADCILLWQIKKVDNNIEASGDNPAYADLSGNKFSVYAREDSSAAIVKTNKGFDAGKYSGLTSVEYTRNTLAGSVVVLRTNSASTSLTINGYVDSSNPTIGDTVKHYEAVGSLVINSVASASYHEFGQVAFAEIATGRIVLESESGVEHIHLTATEGNFNDITVAKASDVEMPEFSRDPVEIPTEGKLVVALQDGTDKDDDKDYVWLTAVGIYEQVTVSDSKTAAKDNFAATSTTASQEQKTAAQQIANNISATVDEKEYVLTATPIIENNVVTGWAYTLESETEQNITENVTVAVVETVTTVSVAGEAKETAKENGLDQTSKDAAKSEKVAEAIQAEEDATPAWTLDGASYATSEEMLAALAEKAEATLVLNKDITIVFGLPQFYFIVGSGKTLAIDLNGHKINVTDRNLTTSAFIKNQGNLTIKDSTDADKNGTGKGAILYEATHPDYQDVPSYANNLISNYGNLTIEGGYFGTNGVYNDTFANEGYASFTIDNYSGGVVTINGGKFFREAQYSYAVRMFCNSTTASNKVTINGGVIEGGYAFWMQTPNNNANMAELIVNGGTFIAHDGFALFFGGAGSTSAGRNYSNTSIVFNGGTLNGVGVAGVPSEDNAPARFEISSVAILELTLGSNLTPTYK